MNKVEKIREALEDMEKGYYIEEYKDLEELIEHFKENDEDFGIEDLKSKSIWKEPVIRHGVPLVTYDNSSSTLFDWAYLDDDSEDIIDNWKRFK